VLNFSFDYSVIESSIFGDIQVVQNNKQKSNLLSSLLPRYPYKTIPSRTPPSRVLYKQTFRESSKLVKLNAHYRSTKFRNLF